MRIRPIGNIHALISRLLIAALLGGCGGYHLVLDETRVLELDADHLAYRVTVKNEPSRSWFCKAERFHGNSSVLAYLTDSPSLDQATVKKPAGGAGPFGHTLPDDPNNAYNFRALDVGETDTLTLRKVTPSGGIDLAATPYLIIKLGSSTDTNRFQKSKTGTDGCNRYGMIKVIDLREIISPADPGK
jgi:hypothetical protein